MLVELLKELRHRRGARLVEAVLVDEEVVAEVRLRDRGSVNDGEGANACARERGRVKVNV